MIAKRAVETRDGRWLAVSGLLFVAAWIVGLIIASPPAISAPMASLMTYYQANRELVMWQAYLANGLTGMLLLVFVAALHSMLRRDEGQSSVLSSLLLGAGIVVVSLSCLEALFMLALGSLITVTQDVAVIRTLLELNVDIDTFKLPHTRHHDRGEFAAGLAGGCPPDLACLDGRSRSRAVSHRQWERDVPS